MAKPIGPLSIEDVKKHWPEAWEELLVGQEALVDDSDEDDPPTPLEDCVYKSYEDPETGEVVVVIKDPNVSGPSGLPLRWYPEWGVWEP
jgi:hypothetical protein